MAMLCGASSNLDRPALTQLPDPDAICGLDVWVRPDLGNAQRVIKALKAFGAPLHDLTETDLAEPGVVFQIGVPPMRIDLLTVIDGVDFAEAWPARLRTTFIDEPTAVLSRHHLIQNKRASGRAQDVADVERLEGHGECG